MLTHSRHDFPEENSECHTFEMPIQFAVSKRFLSFSVANANRKDRKDFHSINNRLSWRIAHLHELIPYDYTKLDVRSLEHMVIRTIRERGYSEEEAKLWEMFSPSGLVQECKDLVDKVYPYNSCGGYEDEDFVETM